MKRLFDLIVAIIALVILSPVLLLIAFQISRKLGSPIFFKQQRPGKKGVIFTLIKFRTLTEKYDVHGHLLPDAQRLHPFGEWLRRYSLDELPELINVISGEMSLVGPRPLLIRYLDRYTKEQARRHEVKPGITGLAQVKGRNALSWEEKFALDIWYVDHQSFALDMKIIFMTLAQWLKPRGINAYAEATAKEFMGSKIVKKENKGVEKYVFSVNVKKRVDLKCNCKSKESEIRDADKPKNLRAFKG